VALATAGSAVAHVLLVWGWRFDWSVDSAVAKGWAGFVLFHTTLGLIVLAAAAPRLWARRCTLAAFPIVTAGAVAAAFKYDYVAAYRWPLIAVFVVVVVGGVLGFKTNWSRPPSAG
jgi:hypothetical protein